VEHGRWSSGSQFNEAKTIVHPSVREQAAVKQKQGDVWAAVTGGSLAPRAANAPAAQVTNHRAGRGDFKARHQRNRIRRFMNRAG